MKQILISEEQLVEILKEETVNITAKKGSINISEYVNGLILTMIIAEIHCNVIERLFHPEEVIDEGKS